MSTFARALGTVVRLRGCRKSLGNRRHCPDVDDAERASSGLDLRTHVNPATPAYEEVSGLQTESIALKGFDVVHEKGKPPGRIGGREGIVSATELALAGANAPLSRRQDCLEGKAERPAVTATPEVERKGIHGGALRNACAP